MREFAYINGTIIPVEEASIHITDLALLRGYGIFDFFRAIDGVPIFMDDHLERFENSVRFLDMALPFSREHLKENILELIKLNQHPLLGIRLLCTGGYSLDGYAPTTPNVMMLAKPFKLADPNQGVKLMLVEHQRELPEVKSINYIKPISLLRQQKAAQADDVLYYTNGFVTESSRSNVFIVKKNKLITAQNGVLFGITRKHILNIAKDHFDVEVRDVSLHELLDADEIFMSGSTKRIVPVTQVDEYRFEKGKVTTKLFELLLENEKNLNYAATV